MWVVDSIALVSSRRGSDSRCCKPRDPAYRWHDHIDATHAWYRPAKRGSSDVTFAFGPLIRVQLSIEDAIRSKVAQAGLLPAWWLGIPSAALRLCQHDTVNEASEHGRRPVEDYFGVSQQLRPDAYFDRGHLDEKIRRYLKRDLHLALRGSSKAGKSWLRQRVLPDAIVVQVRFGHTVVDIYRHVLNALGLTLEVTSTSGSELRGEITAEGEVGINLLAKLRSKVSGSATRMDATTSAPAVASFNDLRVLADLVNLSDRRLVIEDFHYLSISERRRFSSDLKAMWEYGLYVVIIGIWNQNNMLLHFNPDLSGRIREESIEWTDSELRQVITDGSKSLNLEFAPELMNRIVVDSYGNVGLLQSLALGLLDELHIEYEQLTLTTLTDMDAYESAAMDYSEQLVPFFQNFAENVAGGIRRRKDSTGIYAHAMAVILEQDDASLLKGVDVDVVFRVASSREGRIQKGNLENALSHIEAIQVNKETEDKISKGNDDRHLVLAFNPATSKTSVVNRDLLFYRKYQTVSWPWEELIREAAARPAK